VGLLNDEQVTMFLRFHLTLASVSIIVVTGTMAQEPPCDEGLRAPRGNAFGYRPRGDRCEGVYVKQVGGTTMALASLTATFEDYRTDSLEHLILTWGSPDTSVRIRVRGIQPNLYYGMDVAPPEAARSYSWPAGVLSGLKIRQRDIGALAWTTRDIGGSLRKVYLPLRISTSGRASAPAHYTLVVFPGVRLKEVFLTLGPADSAGRPAGKLIRSDQAVDRGYYPPERPIRIVLPSLRSPGLYHVRITARLPDGSPVGLDRFLMEVPQP
jgi:hypothetical protein